MNFEDKETKQRFRRKLMNATNEINGLDAFLQVHNEDDDSAAFYRGCKAQDELKHMASRLDAIFEQASK